jgi:DNA mismatch repair ATPase MutS
MKAFLMHRDRDFDLAQELPPDADDLVQDLALETLFTAMAGDDRFLWEVARRAILCSLRDVAEIRYRQEILRDCLANPAVVRAIYDLAGEAIESERKHYWGLLGRHPGSILHRSVDVLRIFVISLRQLRHKAEEQAENFQSEGFRRLFAMLRAEIDEAYLGVVEAHIERLKFRRGPLISARLGKGNAGTGYVLRQPNEDDRSWARRLLVRRRPAFTFRIHERDEAGARALAELRDRGISIVANATAQSVDHILSFFRMLRLELAFYIGCLNLHEKLAEKGAPACLPEPAPCAQRRHRARGLYDACLALVTDQSVVGNDLDADDKDLFVITGANQGGKSTWLRAIGVAQLMMQCGMFVAARSYCANLCSGLFVHYRREEDAEMRAGKFEEELQRISGIVDRLSADGAVLFNESLQSTNEREGSEIGRQIVEALLDSRIKVFFVTHMYDLAGRLHDKKLANALFLRAERRDDGSRTFRIIPGAPLPTSHGKDVYDEVFAAADPMGSQERGDTRDLEDAASDPGLP